MKIGIFLRNLDKILSEFHEHLQKMSTFAEDGRKLKSLKNCENLVKIPKLMRLFIRSNELFSRLPTADASGNLELFNIPAQ